MLLGPHYIPDSPIYTLVATLFFTLPYILPTYGDTGTAASRGPSPEPDDRRQSQTTTVRTTSQRTPRTIQSINRIKPES